jgi:NAD-dependent dihydropyrimidine dehydrogenase PreA subunit
MIDTINIAPHVILYEGPRAEPLDDALRTPLVQRLLEGGYAVRRTRSAEITLDNVSGAESLVVGRFGGKLPGGTIDSPEVPVRLRDVGDMTVDAVVALVESECGPAIPNVNGKRWKPWFPVIDYTRCTNCMQCLSFCLFGVYGASAEGKIEVRHESNCKTDCPACSRVCPEVAIMFPKYKAGPINGEPVNGEDVRREAMKVDISALLGGDIYSMLRDRSARAKSRFSKERDDERALEERQRCLEKLKSTVAGLDIPPELLASLPSADEIQQKAAQAKRLAQEALARVASTATNT